MPGPAPGICICLCGIYAVFRCAIAAVRCYMDRLDMNLYPSADVS
jgi:hypothetical protein